MPLPSFAVAGSRSYRLWPTRTANVPQIPFDDALLTNLLLFGTAIPILTVPLGALKITHVSTWERARLQPHSWDSRLDN